MRGWVGRLTQLLRKKLSTRQEVIFFITFFIVGLVANFFMAAF